MDDRDKPIETSYAQKVEDFRRRTVPRLVWSMAAVGCLLVFVDRVREFEYIGLDQVPENEISTGKVGVLETAGAEIFDRVPAHNPVGHPDDPYVVASIEKPISETVNVSGFEIDEKRLVLGALALKAGIESEQLGTERLTLGIDRTPPWVDVANRSASAGPLTGCMITWSCLEETAVLLNRIEEEDRIVQLPMAREHHLNPNCVFR